jgi:tetratricopeptide (TPR) repeat protein/O-antigen ligase
MNHSLASFSSHRTGHLILLTAGLLSLIAWTTVQPPVHIAVPLCIGLSWAVSLAVTRCFRRLCLLEQCIALTLIIGCSLELAALFPERLHMIIVMGVVTGSFACYFFVIEQPALAWLTVTLGLTTAPFTELHLERNLWTLIACLTGTLHIIRNGLQPVFDKRRLRWASGIWILMTGLTLISASWAVYPYTSLRFTGILMFNFLVFLQVVTLLSADDQRRRFITVILSFAGVYILAAAVSFLERVLGLGWLHATGFRIYVFERHPNYAIFFLLFTLPLWLTGMNNTRNRVRIMHAAGFFAALLYLLLLSFSRQFYIVLLLYLICIPLLFPIKTMRRFLHRILFSGAGLLFLILVFSESSRARIRSIINLSASLRYNAWRVFMDLVSERPFLGYGMGSARYIYPRALAFFKPGEPSTRQFLFEAHNAYIDILVSLGCAGLVVFLLFLGICTFSRPRQNDIETRIAVILGMTVWIDLFFNFRIHAQDTSVYLMVFLGFIAVVHAGRERINRPLHPPVKKWLLFLPVFPIILFCSTPWLGKHFISEAQRLLPDQNWPHITADFQKAALVEPLNSHPQYYLAMCYENMNNPAESIRYHTRAVDRCPNYPFYRYHLAKTLAENNKIDNAMQHLETAAVLEPYDADARVRFNLGILRWRQGDHRNARQDFWTALLLNPALIDDPYWDFNRDLKTLLTHDVYNFLGGFTSLGPVTEFNLKHLNSAVQLMMRCGHEDFALRCLTAAARTYPANPDIIHQAVYTLIEKDRYDTAQELIYTALAHNKKTPQLYNYLGFIYLRQNEFDMAYYCARQSFVHWNEIAVDNFLGYQLIAEIARRTDNRNLLSDVLPSVAYLAGGKYARQAADLSIHIGTDSYLVKAIQLDAP